jgi:hypothetical protein
LVGERIRNDAAIGRGLAPCDFSRAGADGWPCGATWGSMESASIGRGLLAGLVLATSGCYTGLGSPPSGVDGDGGEAGDGGESDAGDEASDDADPTETCGASPAPLRRLTTSQHRYAIEDLLGLGDADDETLVRLDYLPDGEAGGFAATSAPIDLQILRSYFVLSEELAALYVEQALPGALECDWADEPCVRGFVHSFGRRAFRRPLAPAEVDAAWARHAEIVAQDGSEIAMQTTVAALLASPGFLYHEEPAFLTDDDEPLAPLSAYAFAARLSFLLWSSIPDDALLDAAEADALATASEIRAQVDRMIADPRFDRTIESFHAQWTEIDALDGLVFDDPAWTPTLPQAMREETLRFVDHVFREGDGRIATLLGADFSFADAELAALYGVTAPADGFARVQLDPGTRAGVLTHPSVLARFGVAFPEVHRGRFVRTRVLCGTLPPPGDIDLDPQVDRLQTQPCAGCHTLMDPIGYGFARYDGLGRHRDVDGDGQPIAEDGEVIGVQDGTFTGVRELSDLLVRTPDVERCFALQWTRYATGRMEQPVDSCAIDEFTATLSASDGDLRELVAAIATSQWFRSRAAEDLQ